MSAPRTRIGLDNFGDIVYAELKDDGLVLTSAYGSQFVLDEYAYAALVKYVEQAKVAA